MQRVSVEESVRMLHKSADYYAQVRPVQESVLRSFQKVFECQTRLAHSFAGRTLSLPELNAASYAQGVSWLAGYDVRAFGPLFNESAGQLLPVMLEAFPYGESIRILAGALDTKGGMLGEAVTALLTNDLHRLNQYAESLSSDPGLFAFFLRSISTPVMMAMARNGAAFLRELSWQQGYCPVCGSAPSIGYLSKNENVDLEALVGGGGKKYLHCSLCSHTWRFPRDVCPSCGTNEPHQREILFVAGTKYERAELCQQCKGYVLTIDFREVELEPDLMLAPVALMHLDAVAQQKGGKPVYEAPWNR